MTFIQSPAVLEHEMAGDGLAEPEDRLATQSNSSPSRTELEEDAAAGGAIPLRLYGFAALSGAAAAVVVGLLISVFPLRTNSDPRVPEAIHTLGDLNVQVQGLVEKVRTLDTEAVAGGQTIDALDGRFKLVAGEVGALRTALNAVVAAQDRAGIESTAVNAPALLGVAVVQLRDRLEAGLPFDWELVNLRGIVGSDSALLTELDRLAAMGRTGVVTQQQLAYALQNLVARDGSAASLLQTGMLVASRVLGPKLIEPPSGDSSVLLRAQARLAAGDLANFLRQMQALSAPTAAAAKPLVAAARQRLDALQAVQTLQRAARGGLESQLRSVAAVTPPVGR